MPEKRLLLLRHAKTGLAAEGGEDRDRPLLARGERAAVVVGTYLSQQGLCPDLVLCSSAQRTRRTAELALAQCAKRAAVQHLDTLYMATPRQIRSAIAGVAESCTVLLVVGHNPGLHEFASTLAVAGTHEALAELRRAMPTGALGVFALATSWRDIANGAARLLDFVTPKGLV